MGSVTGKRRFGDGNSAAAAATAAVVVVVHGNRAWRKGTGSPLLPRYHCYYCWRWQMGRRLIRELTTSMKKRTKMKMKELGQRVL